MTRYRTIVADPPWAISWRGSAPETFTRASVAGVTRTKPLSYTTLPLSAICSLPVSELADEDALLWMWATRKVFREGDAARVARAWGFEPCGEVIWGLRNPGLGGANGNDHEPILIARRGALRIDTTKPLGVRFWRQPYAKGKIHSAKPDGFLDLVEQVSPGPYLELFARRQRLGWDTWGDEALEHVRMGA